MASQEWEQSQFYFLQWTCQGELCSNSVPFPSLASAKEESVQPGLSNDAISLEEKCQPATS